MILREKRGNLFSSATATVSLAHCISANAKMGRGIAVWFRRKFGGVREILSQGVEPGGCAVLRRGDRFIYYLVTKELHFNKPTYSNLRSSLKEMMAHCLRHDVKHVAMPRIACGLDGLAWTKVVDMISDVFGETDMIITIYSI